MARNHRLVVTMSTLLFALIAAGCGSTVSTSSGGSGGTGGSGGSSGGNGGTGGSSDPCAGHACGEPCTTCTNGEPCQAEACNAQGECVGAELASCSECPATLPNDGEACTTVGLVCEVDEGIVIVCRARAQCTTKGWQTQAPGCSSEPLVDPGCPAAQPSSNCDVAVDPALCVYGTAFCGCTNCLGGPCGGQAEWVCAAPPAAPCPEIAPKLGAACAAEGTACVYGACPLGGTSGGRTCLGGIWTEDIVACPL